MKSILLNLRVDDDDEKNFEQFWNSVGMNLLTAINMFIKAVLREYKLPFEIRANTNNQDIYTKLKETEEEMNITTKRYSKEEFLKNFKDMIE